MVEFNVWMGITGNYIFNIFVITGNLYDDTYIVLFQENVVLTSASFDISEGNSHHPQPICTSTQQIDVMYLELLFPTQRIQSRESIERPTRTFFR